VIVDSEQLPRRARLLPDFAADDSKVRLAPGDWHGTAWLPPADNLSDGVWNPGNTSPHWNLLLLQATYLF
jgi:hypothetical protein